MCPPVIMTTYITYLYVMCRMNRSIWQLYSREANATKDTRPQFSMPILRSEMFHWEHCWKYHRKCCINLNYSCLRKCLKCPSLNLSKWLPHTSHHHHRHFSPSSPLANCCPVARGGEGWAGLNNRQLLYCTMYNIIALFSIAELYMRNILYSCITES